jgi:type IV pilus assembly protein PilX
MTYPFTSAARYLLTSAPASRQHGASMILVLLMLVVVSILALATARFALQGERGARNDRDREVAFQAAEDALQDAERDLIGPNSAAVARNSLFSRRSQLYFEPDCGSGRYIGLCQPSATGKPIWLTVDFGPTSSRSVPYGRFTGHAYPTGGTFSARPPRYIVEVVRDTSLDTGELQNQNCFMYRVTAIGFGMNEQTQVVLQSTMRLTDENCSDKT